MQRDCDYCGQPYMAKRSTSRFCRTACRVAMNQNPGGAKVVDLAEPERSPLVAKLTAELEAAGRLGTAKAQMVLDMAGSWSSRDPASQRAALMREIAVRLDDALEGAAVANDPLDELKARRERRRSG